MTLTPFLAKMTKEKVFIENKVFAPEQYYLLTEKAIMVYQGDAYNGSQEI